MALRAESLFSKPRVVNLGVGWRAQSGGAGRGPGVPP